MGLIKSAYELAMEKTSGLTVDREALKKDEIFKKGRGLGLKALTMGLESFRKEWSGFSTDLGPLLPEGKKGVLEAWLATFTLKALAEGEVGPQYPLEDLIQIISGQNVQPQLASLRQITTQFSEDVLQLRGAIFQQLGPRLRQRAEQMAAQAGTQVRYVPDRDPEFLKVLNQNLEKLREQYTPHLDQAKAQLTALILG